MICTEKIKVTIVINYSRRARERPVRKPSQGQKTAKRDSSSRSSKTDKGANQKGAKRAQDSSFGKRRAPSHTLAAQPASSPQKAFKRGIFHGREES